MRISIDSPDRLVITHRPVTLSVMLGLIFLLLLWVALALNQKGSWFGTVVMLVGALVAGLLGGALIRRIDLILDRRAGEAHLRNATVFRTTHTRWPLADVTGAQVQQAFSRNDTHTHRPTLTSPSLAAATIDRWLKAR